MTGSLRVHAVLRCDGAVHVGGAGGAAGVDLPLAADGLDRRCIPGSSLAGPLRAWAARMFPDREELVTRFFGGHDGDQAASLLTVHDVPIDEPFAEVRDGVAIDRRTGAAVENLKFDREVLPIGTELRATLDLELDERGAELRALLGHVLGALARSEIRLGARRSAGLGRVSLAGCAVEEESLTGREAVLEALRRRRAAPSAPEQRHGAELQALLARLVDEAPGLRPREARSLTVTIGWDPALPVYSGVGLDGAALDALPLVTGRDRVRPVLPGASIKGVLRAHAERVVRTLLHSVAPTDFAGQIDLPLVDSVFGTTSNAGALLVEDCHAEAAIDREGWRKLAELRKRGDGDASEVLELLRELGLERWQPATHVSLDRWTGGAAAGRLFTLLEPSRLRWEPIVLLLDLARLPEEEARAAQALLLLLVRDLVLGRVPLGFGTRRGLGEVAVREVSVRGPGRYVPAVPGPRLRKEGLRALDAGWVADLDVAWADWLRGHPRSDGEASR